MAESRIPPGASLLLIGSGLYWILSSQLISSFTVLTPGLFQADELGGSLITVVGVVSATVGLWIVKVDFDELRTLFSRSDGWIFTVPLALVAVDVYLTLIVLSTNSQIVELNPFVSICGAAAFGPASNLVLLLDPNAGLVAYFLGALGCTVLSIFLFTKVEKLGNDLGKPKLPLP